MTYDWLFSCAPLKNSVHPQLSFKTNGLILHSYFSGSVDQGVRVLPFVTGKLRQLEVEYKSMEEKGLLGTIKEHPKPSGIPFTEEAWR